jgi:diguanylate cyclase
MPVTGHRCARGNAIANKGRRARAMEGFSLKSRAISFAFSMGAVAFILAILAGADANLDAQALTRAVIVALIFGVMAWAVGEHTIAGVATSVDAATERVIAAAQGDLSTPTPGAVGEALPDLSLALDGLFHQVRSNLESVHALAMFDPVTSLPNRTSFRRDVERLIRTLPDTVQSALIFIDLDHFKAVNDTLGHAHGDQLLGMVANRLRTVARAETARRGDGVIDAVVGRLAGDEFTIFFPQVEDEAMVTRMARGLLAALTEPFELSGHRVDVGASIGIAMRVRDGRSLTALMRAADVAMYNAKARGRGQFQFYTEEMAEKLADRTRLETDLRAAVERDEFTLVFQPQVTLATGQVLSAEALLRWNHPTDGLRMPGSFIGAAEETGLIYAIGDWAMENAAKTLARWPMLGLDHRLSVNLSPRQVARADFFPKLRAALERHQAPLDMLEIEITETIAMECGEVVLREIAALRAQGALVAIDDFGAGYSNLARLRQLPVDKIKLDRSLVVDIATDAEARTILQAVIGLVHGLGCTAVAEGVEDAAQMDVLRVMGCDAVQGFLIATPMCEADYVDWSKVERSALAG